MILCDNVLVYTLLSRWVERLRIVGIQRQGDTDPATPGTLSPTLAMTSSSQATSSKGEIRKRTSAAREGPGAEEDDDGNAERMLFTKGAEDMKHTALTTAADDGKINNRRMDIDA